MAKKPRKGALSARDEADLMAMLRDAWECIEELDGDLALVTMREGPIDLTDEQIDAATERFRERLRKMKETP
jgi:hypothetical protein